LLIQRPLLVRHVTAKLLRVSPSRYTDLSRRTLILLTQQRALLTQLEAQFERRDANGLPPHG
jgi:hypothetical protein